MTSRDFAYWLQGFFELRDLEPGQKGITVKQQLCIRKHLNMVFKHEIDPSFEDQEELQKIHEEVDIVKIIEEARKNHKGSDINEVVQKITQHPGWRSFIGGGPEGLLNC